MAGSFDYDPPPAELTEQATPILVCRYDRSGGGYTLLPNVYCEQVQRKQQAEPSTAQFRYILDDTADLFPSRMEQLWPIGAAPSDYRVQQGDEIVVLRVDPQGNYRVLWDGFAQLPQADISGKSEQVTFVGVGVESRLWDDVVTGRWQRDGSDPKTPGDPFQTDLGTRFNPDDLPNCTPKDTDEQDEESGASWPVFLEPRLNPDPDNSDKIVQTYWDLSKFCRYLLWYYNTEQYVDNPDFDDLAELLSGRAPKEGQTTYDPANPATYTEHPIVIRDFDATNRPAMEVIEQQLEYAGFCMRFICEGGGSGVETPVNRIEIYRLDADGPSEPKAVYLQAAGAALDMAASNVGEFSAMFDFHSIANRWTVETRPTHYEIGVLLAPGFQPASGDGSTANRKKWYRSNQDDATRGVREKYRLYIADECGEGNWNLSSRSWVTGADARLLLSEVFVDEKYNPDGDYVVRYRPGLNKLFSLDPAGKPYRAQLKLSRDYAGLAPPCLWDGTGTWQAIDHGWRLLQDRLGIFIDVEDPMEWGIGKPDSDPAQEQSSAVNAVQSICDPIVGSQFPPKPGRQQLFYLLLTTVIEGDRMIEAVADARPASPCRFVISRQVDSKDHFKRSIIDQSSPFDVTGTEADPITAEDDTEQAQTYADQMRAAHEFPPISATITIPYLSHAYDISDRISVISGRDASLQMNAAEEQGEGVSYPYVVGISWVFTGGQRTVLQLSDRRAEPSPFGRGHSSGRAKR